MLTDRFIHVHIPRTGGTTLRWSIFPAIKGLEILDDAEHLSYSMMVRRCQDLGYPIPPAFAVVRNPWDWYVSQWRWLQQIGEPIGLGNGFSEYMRIVASHSKPNWNFRSLSCAWEYLGVDRTQYIGRFESLHRDIPLILHEIMPDLIDQEVIRTTLSKVKKRQTEHEHYSEYYDDEMRDWVAGWDTELIRRFRYEF